MSCQPDTIPTDNTLAKLVTEHLELLVSRYPRTARSDEPWRTLLHYLRDLHRRALRPKQEATRYVPMTQAIIASHWHLWQTHHGEEPPTYLVEAIDYVEHHYAYWFSYERGEWVDE